MRPAPNRTPALLVVLLLCSCSGRSLPGTDGGGPGAPDAPPRPDLAVHGCGNGTCDVRGGEDCASCPADCGGCATTCGDGICGPGEHCNTCPTNCGVCAPCGDGTCSPGKGENHGTCPQDCWP